MSVEAGHRRRGRRAALLALTLLGWLAGSSPAAALEDGFQVVVSPLYTALTGPFGMPDQGQLTTVTASGGGFSLDLALHLWEGFSLRATGGYAIHPGAIFDGRSVGVGNAGLGINYSLDALRLIPSFDLLPGFYAHDQADGTTQYEFGVMLGASLDYLITPRFFVGVQLRYHVFLSNVSQFPAYLQVGPRFGLQWP